ncbi:MAG: hypothetical protein AVDCRST_MAG49-2395, partial [uncultured Thermomicrobiales bacterium]
WLWRSRRSGPRLGYATARGATNGGGDVGHGSGGPVTGRR